MTGIYIRVKRDGKWLNMEIEYLTEAELRTNFENSDKDRVIMFFAKVTEWMRDNVDLVSDDDPPTELDEP